MQELGTMYGLGMSQRIGRPLNGSRLLELLQDQQSRNDLEEYFGVGLPPEAPLSYRGGYFDRLGGGGDRGQFADVFTAADLIAVEALSVRVPIHATVAILDGDLGQKLATLLSTIPVGIDLADADVHHVDDHSPADRAWHLLKTQTGIGYVTAGKLLARKRPELLPVYDDVVRCAFGWSGNFWLGLREELRASSCQLHHQLLALKRESQISDDVSALRALDVVIWMRHHKAHTRVSCPGLER
jgi:hypothetical protein